MSDRHVQNKEFVFLEAEEPDEKPKIQVNEQRLTPCRWPACQGLRKRPRCTQLGNNVSVSEQRFRDVFRCLLE